MKNEQIERKRADRMNTIAGKVKTKVESRASMLCTEAQVAVEDRMLSVLELLTDKDKCTLGCITSDVSSTRCIRCYQYVG